MIGFLLSCMLLAFKVLLGLALLWGALRVICIIGTIVGALLEDGGL